MVNSTPSNGKGSHLYKHKKKVNWKERKRKQKNGVRERASKVILHNSDELVHSIHIENYIPISKRLSHILFAAKCHCQRRSDTSARPLHAKWLKISDVTWVLLDDLKLQALQVELVCGKSYEFTWFKFSMSIQRCSKLIRPAIGLD